jgi:hypothetical protein
MASHAEARTKIPLHDNKNLMAGVFFIGTGALGLFMAQDYPMGTALRMGPGYFPIVLSAMIILFGIYCLIQGVLKPEPLPARGQIATWLALGAIPSVLWLAVGNQLSQEVAAVPFLWIMPLAIYLLTFVLCFDHDRWYRPRLFRWILPLAWGGIVLVASQRGYVDIRSAVPIG